MSSTSVDANAAQYDYAYEITYVALDVVFAGQVIGPIDVTGDIDPELLVGSGNESGPPPLTFMDDDLEADGDSDGDVDVAAHLAMELTATGYGSLAVTDVFLGDVTVDLGWPFGEQTVQIDRIYLSGVMAVTPVGVFCPADLDGDGAVSVDDLLQLIGGWNGSGAGDLDGDGVVGVNDLLELLAAWGPCE